MVDSDPLSLPLSGRNLIAASAGTGKTYTITSLVLRLIAERGLAIDKILVVTFTEAATFELGARIRARLAEALRALKTGIPGGDALFERLIARSPAEARTRLGAALRDFDTAAVSTIHGFCRRVLSEHAFESGVSFDAELVTDDASLLDDVAHDLWAREVYTGDPLLADYLESVSFGPRELVGLARLAAANPDTAIIPREVEAKDAAAELREAYGEARAVWRAEGAAIEDLLTHHGGIDRRSYSKKNLPRWLESLGSYFEPEEPRIPGERDRLERFTPPMLGKKLKEGHAAPAHRFFDLCERLAAVPGQFEKQLLALRLRFISRARGEQRRRKLETDVQTFDDLLLEVADALRGPRGPALAEAVRSRFHAVLIDECQDTDQTQHEIFDGIYGGTGAPFFLVGDPKQSIYGFRGADIFAYLRAAEHAGSNVCRLGTDWRADPGLVRAVNHLFGACPDPFQNERIDFLPVAPRPGAEDRFSCGSETGPLEIRFVKRGDDRTGERSPFILKGWADARLPDLVAADLASRLGQQGESGEAAWAPSDFAVLVRKNSQARSIQRALGRLGIPGVLWGAESVFASPEAYELADILAAVFHAGDRGLLRAALATRVIGCRAAEIRALDADDDSTDEWLRVFGEWRQLWNRFGVVRLMKQILGFRREGDTLAASLIRQKGGERVMVNLRHLAELLHGRDHSRGQGPLGLMQWFDRQRARAEAGQISDAEELRLESDHRAVTLITIHKSKGLEFNNVYLPYLWEGPPKKTKPAFVLFHDPARGYAPAYDIGSERFDEHRALAEAEERAESMRLAYVALTRARHRAVVIWGAFQSMTASPLGHLLHHAGETAVRTAARLSELTDDEMLGELDALREASGGAIGVGELAEVTEEVEWRSPGEPRELRHRPWRGRIATPLAVASFTSMAKGGDDRARAFEAEARDHDAWVSTGPEKGRGAAEQRSAPDIAFAEMPRGALAGSCLHAIYEELDFRQEDQAGLRGLVARKLVAFGFEPALLADPVARSVSDSLDTVLLPGEPGFTLRGLPSERRLNELEFLFPVARGESSGHGSAKAPVSPRGLARVFESCGGESTDGYGESLARLAFSPFKGFMKGFIDLVFAHRGRYYLLDYKSNHLGDEREDYGPERLARVMAEHHYILQYHLYTVALHRYLGFRLRGYDYDEHFGGAGYVFLRGLSPETGTERGVYFQRPEKRLVEALSSYLERGE